MLANVKWFVEEETLCRVKGVFSKQTDYIEMYRITDFQESQSFLQRLLGVKSVTVFSTDQSDDVTVIPGVPADLNLIGIIRE
ncbi:MAG: PH domain-containing protein, partial [Bacteroidales bacterium]|nr:PH domain-containing protein [Bacteroidales bacterium]